MSEKRVVQSNRIRRLPPYMFARLNQMLMQARHEGRDIIDMGMGNPDHMPAGFIVDKLCEVARDSKAHRYSASKGIKHLRLAIADWYKSRFDVGLDPETEVIATIGSKEGLVHLMLAALDEGDTVLVPNPTYPIHIYGVMIAGGNVCHIPLTDEETFLRRVAAECERLNPAPKILIVSFPNNPTAKTVELPFFKEVVALARKYGLIVIHDFAYSELCFDGYEAPSFLQVAGAKEVGVEFHSMSKTYSMPGWRIGFCVGNPEVVGALTKLKSYYDYGIFTPLQVAAIVALRSDQECVKQVREEYRSRRDVLVDGMQRMGWPVERPKATMYVWAPVPPQFAGVGSMDFSIKLLEEGDVVASPGVGFGEYGEGFLRFALVENEHRIKQALKGMKKVLGGVGGGGA